MLFSRFGVLIAFLTGYFELMMGLSGHNPTVVEEHLYLYAWHMLFQLVNSLYTNMPIKNYVEASELYWCGPYD